MKFKIFRFKKIKSTNDKAINIIKNTNFDYGMVIAETQSKGKGQYGKRWISYKGNLFVSFFYKINDLTISLRKITLINCLLVKKLLNIYYKKKIVYKKPNDLLINKKKICGILQETITKLKKRYLVVGIGLNLKKNPNIRNYPTTNLYELIDKKFSKIEIEKELKKIFEKKFSMLIKNGLN